MIYRFHQDGTYDYKDVDEIKDNANNHDCSLCQYFKDGDICLRLKAKVADRQKGCDKYKNKGGNNEKDNV